MEIIEFGTDVDGNILTVDYVLENVNSFVANVDVNITQGGETGAVLMTDTYALGPNETVSEEHTFEYNVDDDYNATICVVPTNISPIGGL